MRSLVRPAGRIWPLAGGEAALPQAAHAAAWAALGAIVFIAAIVRAIGIDASPLWLDEIISLHRASLPVGTLIADSLAHLHYPTYFLLLSAVLWLLGDSDLSLRLPSLVFGILCVPVGYAIARRIAGLAAGLAAAALITLSPIQVMYSQEARSYTLVTLLIMVALWGFVRLAADARSAALSPRALLRPAEAPEIAARTSWAAWAGGTAGALIVLNIAVFWLIASLAGMATIRMQLSGNERARFDRTLLIAVGLIAVIWLPWAIAVSPSLIGTAQNGFWAPPVTSSAIVNGIWAVYLFGVAEPLAFEPMGDLAPVRALAIAALAATGAWSLRHNRAVAWTLIASVALPPLLLVAASAVTPVFVPRYLCAGAPAFLVLAGCGLAAVLRAVSWNRLWPALAALVIFADLSANLRTYHEAEVKPRWDLAASVLAQSLGENDRVLFHDGFARFMIQSKLNRSGNSIAENAILNGPDALDRSAFSGWVWVAYGRVGGLAAPTESEIREWLSDWGEPVKIKRLGKQVGIAVFELSPPETQVAILPPHRRLRGRRPPTSRT